MLRRSSKLLLEVVGTLVAGLAIAVAALAWRLSSGPISLDFLTPYVEQALEAPGTYRVKLDSTVLTWSGWAHPLDLRVRGVHVLGAQDQSLVALPEAGVGISVRALVQGVIAPTSLEVIGAHVHLRRGENGRLDLELSDDTGGQEEPNVLRLLIGDLLQPADPERPLSYLRQIRITNADLVIDDSHWDTSWKARLSSLTLKRNPAGMQGTAVLELTAEGITCHISAAALYDAAIRQANLKVEFNNFQPGAFTHLAPALEPLSRVSLPLSGVIATTLDDKGTVGQLGFEVSGGEGHVALPELYSKDVAVKHLEAKGTVTNHGDSLTLTDATVDLGGPTIALAGNADKLGGESTMALDLTVRHVKLDELAQRWPEKVATNPRDWITKNLSGGEVEELQASLAAHGHGIDPDSIKLDKITGTMKLAGIDVHYLRKMPKVHGVAGNARFDKRNFAIDLDKGTIEGLSIDEGKIAISGLDVHDQDIDIRLALHGPLRGALQLIDNPPLGYASGLGVDPETVSGDVVTQLQFKFPLLKNLTFAQVQIAAAADMKDAGLAHVFFGHDLTHGDLALNVEKSGMQIAGTGDIGPVPVSLNWDETFGKTARSRIELRGTLDDSARKALDLDAEGILAGSVPVALVLTRCCTEHSDAQIDLDLDLTDAAVTLPHFTWRKAPGVAGKAHAALLLAGEKLSAMSDLSVDAGDLVARAQASFDASGHLNSAKVPQLSFGRTKVAGEVVRRSDGTYGIDFHGDGFDAAGFLKEGKKEKPEKPEARGPKLAIKADVAKLWLSDSVDLPFSQASATIDYDGKSITSASISAKTMSGAATYLQIAPMAKGRQLNISSDNAGDVMKALDAADNLIGGRLKITGAFDDSKPDPPLNGSFRIDDYQLRKAPFIAKLLTVASLTGILDQLSGEGLGFSSLIASFTKIGGHVDIRDGRTAGSALGLTFEGALDFDTDIMNVNGTIVPIYTLNSLLGNIPLIGDILVGPKGGGVFAATYYATGKIEDPDISVNPLTALAPGILRGLLDIFPIGGSGNKPPPTQQPAPAPQRAPIPQTAPAPQPAPKPPQAPMPPQAPIPPQQAPPAPQSTPAPQQAPAPGTNGK